MERSDVASIARQCFAAYEHDDRALLDSLLAEDFTFTSPRDDHLDRATYFERCWPGHEHIRAIHISHLMVEGNDALVRYQCEPVSGEPFWNVEYMRVTDGKLQEVTVYFGSF